MPMQLWPPQRGGTPCWREQPALARAPRGDGWQTPSARHPSRARPPLLRVQPAALDAHAPTHAVAVLRAASHAQQHAARAPSPSWRPSWRDIPTGGPKWRSAVTGLRPPTPWRARPPRCRSKKLQNGFCNSNQKVKVFAPDGNHKLQNKQSKSQRNYWIYFRGQVVVSS